MCCLHAIFLTEETVGNSNLRGRYCLTSKFWARNWSPVVRQNSVRL